jgi:hypothetical protein
MIGIDRVQARTKIVLATAGTSGAVSAACPCPARRYEP